MHKLTHLGQCSLSVAMQVGHESFVQPQHFSAPVTFGGKTICVIIPVLQAVRVINSTDLGCFLSKKVDSLSIFLNL